jgi:hypothetical protein
MLGMRGGFYVVQNTFECRAHLSDICASRRNSVSVSNPSNMCEMRRRLSKGPRTPGRPIMINAFTVSNRGIGRFGGVRSARQAARVHFAVGSPWGKPDKRTRAAEQNERISRARQSHLMLLSWCYQLRAEG